MRKISLLTAIFLATFSVGAQEFARSRPARRASSEFGAIAGGLVTETGAAARDLVTLHDPKWTFLTIAQIGAATADAETSLHNFHRCPTCVEKGIARLVVGGRPDAHKYIVAGLIEISVEAVTAHYLRNHGPIRKWYWRYLWAMPQTFSLYEHTRADFHNTGLQLRCDSAGLNCF
jgi:hypothetical protein